MTYNEASQQIITVSKKKRPKRFCNIFYKTRAILVKFGTPFPE